MKKKILFISHDGMTDPLGLSQVIPYLSKLTVYGYSFVILSCEKPDRYKANKDYVQTFLKPFDIKWVSIPYHRQPPVLSSLFDFFQLRKKAYQLHKQYRFDLVHTRIGLPALIGLELQKKQGVKFLNDIRGFWADERVDGGIWNLKNPLYKTMYHFFRKKEDEYVAHADYNVCLTYAAKKEILSWEQISNHDVPVEVIPCCVDMELFNPDKIIAEEKQRLKEELNISGNDFIVSYLGSIGGWYLTDEMMRFCKLLSDKMPNAKFLFISPHLHSVIADAAAKNGLSPEKLIVRKGLRHEVPLLMSLSNYSIFFIKPCYSKIASSPTKHGEIMSMGIPVITNKGVGDVEEIVSKYQSGFLVNDFSDSSFEEVINQITWGESFNAEQIREGARDFYNVEIAVSRYLNIYNKILEAPAKKS